MIPIVFSRITVSWLVIWINLWHGLILVLEAKINLRLVRGFISSIVADKSSIISNLANIYGLVTSGNSDLDVCLSFIKWRHVVHNIMVLEKLSADDDVLLKVIVRPEKTEEALLCIKFGIIAKFLWSKYQFFHVHVKLLGF